MDALVASPSFFVVANEGRVQGFYRATRQQGRAGHAVSLGTFAIAPAAQGTGVARSILEEAISRLHSESATRFQLPRHQVLSEARVRTQRHTAIGLQALQ
jgi:GNAT superfamily N-acetyltransferase